jgi:hypothetical protein
MALTVVPRRAGAQQKAAQKALKRILGVRMKDLGSEMFVQKK